MLNWHKKAIFLSIVFTVLPQFADASDCKDIRLDRLGSAFDRIPIYNQVDNRNVDSNICYAIASSQLIDEYRFRNGDFLQKISSPLSLAVGYKEFSQDSVNKNYATETISSENITQSILGGGFIEETLTSAHKIEICDQYAIEKDVGLIFPKTVSAEKFVERILLGDSSTKVNSFTKTDFLLAVKNEVKIKCQYNHFSLLPLKVESLSAGNYLEDLVKLTAKLQSSFLLSEEKASLTKEFYQKYDKSKIIKEFKEKVKFLLENNYPIGIGYMIKVLQRNSGSNDYSGHASIITGQRKNPDTEVCELLVRDSYGSSCKNDRGQNRYNLPCENGSVWVPEDSLLGETLKITWIP